MPQNFEEWSAASIRVKHVSGRYVDALCLADIFDNKLSDNRLSTGSNLASEAQEFFFKKLFSSIFTIEKIVIFALKHVF